LWTRAFSTDPETGVMIRILVTVVLVVALATSPVANPWLWAAVGVSFVLWLVWAVFATLMPRTALGALIACAVIATAAMGTGAEGASLLTCLALPGAAGDMRLRTWQIVAVIAGDLGIFVASAAFQGRTQSETFGLLGLLVVLVMIGLTRRQFRMRAVQTELLLEQTKKTQAEQARAAALDERARIAREMHDVLAHSLGALSVQLEVAEALLSEKNDPGKALERVRRSRRLAVEGLAEARRAVAALRSDVPPLPEALTSLVETYRRDHHATVTLRTTGEHRPVSAPATVSLLATAREALTNAAKHAPNVPVDVLLDYGPEAVVLNVTNAADHGPDQVQGYGLAGMRERIALVGGTLTAGFNATRWRVVAEVPE
jgi:signal transduction histidine kinase